LLALTELLVGRTGMATLRDRASEVDAAACERSTAAGCRSGDEFAAALIGGELRREEVDELVAVLTIGETYFFRHEEVFDALRTHVFPAWAESAKTWRAWSAACSVGCEAYSLAIAWRDVRARLDCPRLEILATDINRAYLARARRADYGKWHLRNMPSDQVERLFNRRDDSFVLRQEFRKGVDFRVFNLLDDPATLGLQENSLDLVFCRNVMIYFEPAVVAQLAKTFFSLLKPGGWLVTGASECNSEIFAEFSPVTFPGAIFYRKPGAAQRMPELRIPDIPQAVGYGGVPAWVPPVLPQPPPAPRRARASAPDPRADAMVDLLAGRHAGADAKLDHLIRLNNLEPELYFLRALAQENLGRHADAETSYRQCLFLNRNHPAAQANLALLLAKTGRRDAADRAARSAVRLLASLDPNSELLCAAGPVPVKELAVRLTKPTP
jgi:chemotaxis protein methyltransferase CheR